MTRADALAAWLRRHMLEAGAKGLVFGLSGGIDSAVVARLCQIAAPGAALGVMMPCHSDSQDERDARLLAAHFALPLVKVDLAAPYAALVQQAEPAVAAAVQLGLAVDAGADPRMVPANVKPRLRMTTLYFIAGHLGYLVVGTGNRSEIAIGYFTKHGDGAVDLLPLGHLFKSEVRALARELDVPAPIIEKPPSAGLWAGQTDEGEMGFTYEDLEAFIARGADSVSPAVAARIERLVRASAHKRALVPIPED